MGLKNTNMAKRFYNLERETKEALKEADRIGLSSNIADVSVLNDVVAKNKALGVPYSPEDVLMLRGNPYFFANFSNQYCFKPLASGGLRNLADFRFPSYMGTAPYGSWVDNSRGGVLFARRQSAYITPFNFFGSSSSFTISLWVRINSRSTSNAFDSGGAGYIGSEMYLANGFRSSLGSAGNFFFWSTQSGGNLSIGTPNNSMVDGNIYNLVVSFDSQSGYAAVYLNGLVSASASGKTILPYASASYLSLGYGAYGGNAGDSESIIYSILAHSRSLSAAEILDNYNITKWRFGL